MNTFITDYDFRKNAKNLDNKRLFKQLLEGKQILDILVNNKKAWANHPAVLQWKGFEVSLSMYLASIWAECQKRGIAKKSNLFNQIKEIIGNRVKNYPENTPIFPKWWGREDILISHRSRLKCKGLIDVQCEALKKHYKVKNLDYWLLDRFGKTKNQLRFSDAMKSLDALIIFHGLKLNKNHYDLKEWKKIPYNLEYVWPILTAKTS